MSHTAKPRIYIETSIISYLVSRPSGDVRVAANQVTTMVWWDERRPAFDLFVSELVLVEAALGDPVAARRRLDAIGNIPELDATDEVRTLGDALMTEGPAPLSSAIDAPHSDSRCQRYGLVAYVELHPHRQCSDAIRY